MPRIDPHQLLECLKILLNDHGGIRTEEDVSRVANLMGKFSKKLVSKCIYVLILKHTDNRILDMFLTVGGWTLVYSWLTDAYSNRNWPFIVELLDLIVLSPMDIERLKHNDCPKLVKTISKDSTNFAAKSLASQAVENWLQIVKGGAALITQQQHHQQQIELTKIITMPSHSNESTFQSGIVNIGGASTLSGQTVTKTVTKTAFKANEIKVLSGPIVEIPPQSFYKSTMKSDNKKAIVSNHANRIDKVKRSIIKSKNKLRGNTCEMSSTVKKLSEKDLQTLAAIKMTQNVAKLGRIPKKTPTTSTTTSSTVTATVSKPVVPVDDDNWDDDMNSSDANTTLENNINGDNNVSNEEDLEKKNLTMKISNGMKKGQMVKKVGPNASLVVTDTKNKKPVKVYSSKGRNTGLDEEIKRPKIVKKSTLITKKTGTANVNKTEMVAKKLKESVQGAVGVVLPVNQSYIIQPQYQTAGQTFNDATIVPQYHSITGQQEQQQSITLSLPIGYQTYQSTSNIVPVIDISENDRTPQVLPDPQLAPSRLFPSQSATATTTAPVISSPSSELKRKHVIQESDLFMESLTASTTKEVKKKRKRTLAPQSNQSSNTNTLVAVSSNSETVAMTIEAPKFYTECENADESKASEEDEQSNSDLSLQLVDSVVTNTTAELENTPKQGVLCLFRKKGLPKKSVRWKAENDLIQIRYFEMDENERTNVAKSCTDMKQADSQFERQTLNRKAPIDDNMEEKVPWRIPSLITLDPPLVEPGSKSTEREVQANRERIVLQTLYFDKNSVPDSPYEPDFEFHPSSEPVTIPLDDIHGRATVYRYKHIPWPEQKVPKPETSIQPNNNNHSNLKVNNGNHIFHNNNNNSNNMYKNKRPNKKGLGNHKYYKYKKY